MPMCASTQHRLLFLSPREPHVLAVWLASPLLLALGRRSACRSCRSRRRRTARSRGDIALGLRRGERLARRDVVGSHVLMLFDLVVGPLQLGLFQMNAWALHLKVEVA